MNTQLAKNISKLKPTDFATPTIKNAVKTLLMAKVYAETMREELDKEVYRPALHIEGRPIYSTEGRHGRPVKPITEHKDAWLMSDEDSKDYHAECQHQIKKRAVNNKAYRVNDDCCPALVAEALKTDAEWALLTACEPLTGITNRALCCAGLDKRRRYIEIICGLVVTQCPEYFEETPAAE